MLLELMSLRLFILFPNSFVFHLPIDLADCQSLPISPTMLDTKRKSRSPLIKKSTATASGPNVYGQLLRHVVCLICSIKRCPACHPLLAKRSNDPFQVPLVIPQLKVELIPDDTIQNPAAGVSRVEVLPDEDPHVGECLLRQCKDLKLPSSHIEVQQTYIQLVSETQRQIVKPNPNSVDCITYGDPGP